MPNLQQKGNGRTARVSMVYVGAVTVTYSVVRCPNCNRRIMDVPGTPEILVRTVGPKTASGKGRCLTCSRCKNTLEVIERR